MDIRVVAGQDKTRPRCKWGVSSAGEMPWWSSGVRGVRGEICTRWFEYSDGTKVEEGERVLKVSLRLVDANVLPKGTKGWTQKRVLLVSWIVDWLDCGRVAVLTANQTYGCILFTAFRKFWSV